MDTRRPRAPHPAISHARRTLAELLSTLPEAPSALVVGVSGGSDSMAGALVAGHVARKAEIRLVCAIVDHSLRPDSAEEAALVRERLETHGFTEVRIARVDGAAGKGGPEAAARAARYKALAALARETGGAIVLGHTADDQAETVLLRLARGSGSRSVAGMAPVASAPGAPDVLVLRPLLGVRRNALREALAGMGVDWVDDPTNAPDSPFRAADGSALRRNALRNVAIPGLNAALGISVVEPLVRTATLLQRDNSALDEWADFEFAKRAEGKPDAPRLAISELAPLPVAIRTRILRRAAIDAGAKPGALTFWHLEHLDNLLTGAGRVAGHRSIDLPAADPKLRLRARQDKGILVFERFSPSA